MSVNVVDNNMPVTPSQEVEVANELVTNTVVNEYPNTISVKSNEFAIVGDGLFATTKEEVPGWMRELVGDLAKNATADTYNAMAGFNYNLYNAMIALQVAENQYTQAINTKITDQEAFVQAVETLNSTVQNAEAEIVGIKQTYATKDFAVATAAQTLEASLNGGAIKSSLGQLASTMTNQYGTMAQRMDVLESTFEDQELKVEGYANATDTLETYVGLTEGVPDGTGLLAKVEVLEKQNDGIIETTTGTYDVILRAAEPDFSELVTTAEPYASWLAAEVSGGIDVRLSHIGDVYIKYQDTASGAKEYVGSYKFIRTIVDTTTPHSTDSAGFTWAVIQDQAAEMAYTVALNAHDLADGKRRVFVATPVGPYDVGDLWVREVGGSNQIWRATTSSTVYNVVHWKLTSTDDTAVNNILNGTTSIANAKIGSVNIGTYVTNAVSVGTDNMVHVYSGNQNQKPTTAELGDLYVETNSVTAVVTTYRWNGASWAEIKGASNVKALADLSDGKRTIYTTANVPTDADAAGDLTVKVNDLWIPPVTVGSYRAKEIYICTSVNPITFALATDYYALINNVQAQVDGKVDTYYQATVPYSNQVNVSKDVRAGDYWYCTANTGSYIKGNIYKYLETANGSKYNYTWTLTADVTKSAFDAIDSKKTIFGGAAVPTAVAVNDIWVPNGYTGTEYTNGFIYQWNGTVWDDTVKYTDDTAVTALQNGLANGTTTIKLTNAYVGTVPLTTYLSSEIDSKVGVYSGTTAPVAGQPSGVAVNDIYLWFTTRVASGKTYDITVTYKYNGSAWVEITTNDDITNLADLADGKRTIFGGATVPTGALERDIWIPSANNGSYVKGEIYQYIGGVWSATTRYTADMQALTSNVQTQIDSKVDTYYQAAVPFANATNVARKTQAGDYWYCTLTSGSYVKGKMYKYTETANGSNWNYTWTETADVTKYVFDLADGKASIFTTSAQPSSYKINDMMIVTTANFSNGTTTFSNGVVLTSNAIRVSGFVAADWVKKINDTEDLDAFVSGIYTPTVASLQSQVDGQINYYFFDSGLGQSAASVSGSSSWTTDVLKKEHNGDIAYDTKLELGYWYDRSVSNWVQITGAQNAGVIEALKKAAEAKEAADDVIVSYYAWKQATAPATQYKWMKDDNTLWEYVGSTWVVVDVKKDDTLTAYNNTTKDTTLYVHNGSVWTMITPNGIVANAKAVTDLNTNLSSLGTTVAGHTSLLNTVESKIGAEGARVESKFAYDSTLTLNGTTYNSGFGLATSLTSGSGIPVGSSEFWINADKFKLTTTGYNGVKYSPFSVNGTDGTITFNGKVSFSNVTGYTDPATQENLINNSSFAGSVNPWFLGWNPNGAQITHFGVTTAMLTPEWVVPGINGLTLQQVGRLGTTNYRSIAIDAAQELPCSEGVFYEISAYVAAHRCQMTVGLAFYNSAGTHVGESPFSWYTVGNGGNTLERYTRVSIRHQAPTGAVKMSAIIRKKDTDGGYTDSWIFALRPQVVRVDSLTGPAVDYRATTTIDGGKIATGTIQAGAIAAGSVSADKLSPSTGTSTVWSGGGLVSANFNGNASGDIGTPTQGFRVSSNAAGTSSDPNIYGASIQSSSLFGGQSGYDTGIGFFLGLVGGVPKFSVGNSSGRKITWDGNELFVSGGMRAYTGTTQVVASCPVGSVVVAFGGVRFNAATKTPWVTSTATLSGSLSKSSSFVMNYPEALQVPIMAVTTANTSSVSVSLSGSSAASISSYDLVVIIIYP